MTNILLKFLKKRNAELNIKAKEVKTKTPLTVNSRSKALNPTIRRQKVNLQKSTINGEKLIISAREAKKVA